MKRLRSDQDVFISRPGPRADQTIIQRVTHGGTCRRARKHYIYRSAITGKFVSKAYAKRYPKRTVRERV
jgi:hypothetical protein